MYVKNVSARLITINAKGYNPAQVPPGGKSPVKLTKEQAETQFVESMIENGELIEVAAPKDAPKEEGPVFVAPLPVTPPSAVEQFKPENESNVAELRAQLDALEVKYDKRWGADRLQQEVDKALDK